MSFDLNVNNENIDELKKLLKSKHAVKELFEVLIELFQKLIQKSFKLYLFQE